MINTINNSYYYNYCKANKHPNKSEDKIKNTEIDNKKENNTMIPKHKTIIDKIKKNEFKIRVSQIDKRDNKENINTENIDKRDSKIRREIRQNKDKRGNIGESREILTSKENDILEVFSMYGKGNSFIFNNMNKNNFVFKKEKKKMRMKI